MLMRKQRTAVPVSWVRKRITRFAMFFVVALSVVGAIGVADAHKVMLESGRVLHGDAEVGSDIVRLDLGKKGILTLPGVRVKRVYDGEKGRNIYSRGEVRGRKGIQMGTIGITRSHARPTSGRMRQPTASASRSRARRQSTSTGGRRPSGGMAGRRNSRGSSQQQ